MKTRRIVPLLLAIVLIVGMLPASAFAYEADVTFPDRTGESFEVKDGIIKVFVPYDGYEGTEEFSLPYSSAEEKEYKLIWMVKGDTGTLRVGHPGDYTEVHDSTYKPTDSYGIWIDGGSFLKETIIELEDDIFNYRYSGIRVSGGNLTICTEPGATKCFDIYMDQKSPFNDGSIIVDNGDLTIRNAEVSVTENSTANRNIKQTGIYVPKGNITIEDDGIVTTMSWTVLAYYDKQKRSMVFGNPRITDNHILTGKSLIVEGALDMWSVGQENTNGALVQASSIQLGHGYVAAELNNKETRPIFSVTPKYIDSEYTGKKERRGTNGAQFYYYSNAENPIERLMIVKVKGDKKYVAGDDFDESTLDVSIEYYPQDKEYSLLANEHYGDPAYIVPLTDGYSVIGGKDLQAGWNSITVKYKKFIEYVNVKADPDKTPTAAVASAPVSSPSYVFSDVPASAWFYDDVMAASSKGLFNGKSETTFAPNDNMTVAEAVKLAASMNQLYNDGKVTLSNGSGKWYDTYMKYALDNGIIASDLTSRANEPISREEYVSIFYKALPDSEYAVKNEIFNNAIPDVKADNQYANEIYTFYRSGILTGDSNGAFNPRSNIKRCEVAAILVRMMDENARKDVQF